MKSDEQLREIGQFLHEKIPLTRAMGVAVEAHDASQFIVTAPLDLNHNHLGTAFGGSLSVMATLAGYGMIWLELGDRGGHVVIRDSAIRFRRPVRGPIRAVCRRPDEEVLRSFKEEFAQKGKARLKLSVTIDDDGQRAVEFEGTFVAQR